MTTPKLERQTWSNRLTYVLTVAGATVGFGATWRFPYLVGENGGGAYVLLFCIAMIVIGIPMILVENVIGRRLRVNSIDAFGDKILDKGKGISKYWKLLGYMGLLGAFGIMAYYMVLGGWVITYIINLISVRLIFLRPSPKMSQKISMIYISVTAQLKSLFTPHFLYSSITLFWQKALSAALNAP